MSTRAEEIRIVHRVVGSKHVLTSPDVPELHLSHADEVVARADVQPALDAIVRTKARLDGKQAHRKMLGTA